MFSCSRENGRVNRQVNVVFGGRAVWVETQLGLLELTLLLFVDLTHLLDLLHRLEVHIPDLLLDYRLFGLLRLLNLFTLRIGSGLGSGDLLLLLLLLQLELFFNHLLLAWLLAILVTARVLLLVPAPTAGAWTGHYTD